MEYECTTKLVSHEPDNYAEITGAPVLDNGFLDWFVAFIFATIVTIGMAFVVKLALFIVFK